MTNAMVVPVKLVKLGEIIDLPDFTQIEGEEVNAKDVENKNVVIHSVQLQNGRGEKKGDIVGCRFNLELTDNPNGEILGDGKRVYFVSRNEFVVKQGSALAKANAFPILAKLHKNGRSFYWGDAD